MESQSIDHMIRSMFMLGVSEKTLSDELRAQLLDFRPGSVILTLRLFQQNGATKKESLIPLCKSLHELSDEKGNKLPTATTHKLGPLDLLIGIDHEGGFIQHLPPPTYTHFPTAGRIGATENPSIATRVGEAMGRELRAIGIDWNFAPVLDVPTHPKYHFARIQRTISHNPEQVATMGAALITGMQSEGLIACPKHFPGMGRTEFDSHISKPKIEATVEELHAVDLLPFQKAILAGTESIMTNHGLCKLRSRD
jgi:beta-N-acetylhexosaminidase